MDILLVAAVLFISWTSVNHRVWPWPSVQVDVSCVGYGQFHFSCFIWGIYFFFKSRWGYSQDVAQDDIYSIYTFVGAFNVSPDSSEDTEVGTHRQVHIFSLQTCMQTHVHTRALTNSDQSLGDFLCHAGSFIQRDINRQWDKQTPRPFMFCFELLEGHSSWTWVNHLRVSGQILTETRAVACRWPDRPCCCKNCS